ncbi:uncharacterized protein LOC143225556 isoform X2 [Tachypleus tridentatus]|uniref:uncharacterized protein LOC143225556 isoform X2 n=1 Tax=Tachypleus tridentatus TaxID=6853 RepID=UPI003FCEE87D
MSKFYPVIGLYIVCQEFFTLPMVMVSEKLKTTTAVKYMAVLTIVMSAPEFAITVSSVCLESQLGTGTIFGTAIYKKLVIIPLVGAVASKTLVFDWRPLVIDGIYYASCVLFVNFIHWNGYLWWVEGFMLFLWYFLYFFLIVTHEELMNMMAVCGRKIWINRNYEIKDLFCNIYHNQTDESVGYKEITKKPNCKFWHLHEEYCEASDVREDQNNIHICHEKALKSNDKQPKKLLTEFAVRNNKSEIVNNMPLITTPQAFTKTQMNNTTISGNIQSQTNNFPLGDNKALNSLTSDKSVITTTNTHISTVSMLPIYNKPVMTTTVSDNSTVNLLPTMKRYMDNVMGSHVSTVPEIPVCKEPATYTCNQTTNMLSTPFSDFSTGSSTSYTSNIVTTTVSSHGETGVIYPSTLGLVNVISDVSLNHTVDEEQPKSKDQEDLKMKNEYASSYMEQDYKRSFIQNSSIENDYLDNSRDIEITDSIKYQKQDTQSSGYYRTLLKYLLDKDVKLIEDQVTDNQLSESSVQSQTFKWSIRRMFRVICLPFLFLFWLTIPNCSQESKRKWFCLSLLMCLVWISATSFTVVVFALKLTCLLNMDAFITGVTVISFGLLIPDAFSAFVSAKNGYGSRRILMTQASNMFNITVVLGFSYLLYCIKKFEYHVPLLTREYYIISTTATKFLLPTVKVGFILLFSMLLQKLILISLQMHFTPFVKNLFLFLYFIFITYILITQYVCEFYC